MKRKILITGGAGFIGSTLAEELLKKGYAVHILDIKKHPENLQSFKCEVNYLECDVSSPDLHDAIRDVSPDGIVHLAAVSRVIWCEENPELCRSTNIGGTLNLMKTVSELPKRPWIIFGSSREVYGEQKNLPVKEDSSINPINTYGIAKAKGEVLIREYSNKYQFKGMVLRFSNVFGNEKDIMDRVIPRFTISMLNDEPIEIHGGNQIFDFTYIEDTVNGIMKAIDYIKNHEKHSYIDTFHILTGKPTRIVDLPSIIGKQLGKTPEIIYTKARSYDVEKFYGDPSKARRILDFSSKIDISTGLKKTIENIRGADI